MKYTPIKAMKVHVSLPSTFISALMTMIHLRTVGIEPTVDTHKTRLWRESPRFIVIAPRFVFDKLYGY